MEAPGHGPCQRAAIPAQLWGGQGGARRWALVTTNATMRPNHSSLPLPLLRVGEGARDRAQDGGGQTQGRGCMRAVPKWPEEAAPRSCGLPVWWLYRTATLVERVGGVNSVMPVTGTPSYLM